MSVASMKAAIDNMQTSGHVCVPLELYVQILKFQLFYNVSQNIFLSFFPVI